MQSLFVFLSNLVLFLTLTTLIFACGAYFALLMRRRRPHGRRPQATGAEVSLLRRYVPPER